LELSCSALQPVFLDTETEKVDFLVKVGISSFGPSILEVKRCSTPSGTEVSTESNITFESSRGHRGTGYHGLRSK